MSGPACPLMPYKKIDRIASFIVFGSNITGAALSYIYLAVLAPEPGSGIVVNSTFQAILPTVIGTGLLLFIGSYFARRRERYFPTWYQKIYAGEPAGPIPQAALKEVLNYPFASAVISLIMWFVAGLAFGLFLTGSWRAFSGIFLVGGVLTSVLVYMSLELLWRRVIPAFFPGGGVSAVKAVRISVLRRLLLAFFIVSVYPIGMIMLISLERARRLLTTEDPLPLMNNLVVVEVFILVISLAANIGLAFLVTRSIVAPLVELQKGMDRVEHKDLNVSMPVTSNDELGYLADRFNAMVDGLRRGELLRNLLNLYVSPEVAREALEHGTGLGGEVVDCTVLFADIRGFTSLSEKLAPEVLIDMLNRYMGRMVAVIVESGGMVNKFGGDSLLAVFGTPLNPRPDHAAAGIQAALGMRDALALFNSEQERLGGPTLQIGIGIASGKVVAGNIGGEGRIEYTVIGDTVNLASRLQDLTRDLGTAILVNQAAAEGLPNELQVTAVPLAPLQIRGRTEPVQIFSIER